MTNQQRQQIHQFRQAGATYAGIATQLGLSINTVKAFCRRKGIQPLAQLKRRSKHELVETTTAAPAFCFMCGQPLQPQMSGRPRRFCSNQCRYAYWNKHRNQVRHKAVHYFTCQYCGKNFESYGQGRRKYCCHQCYIKDRYGEA